MILILSAGGGNQEGAFGPFLDFSRDGRGRFAARRGRGPGAPFPSSRRKNRKWIIPNRHSAYDLRAGAGFPASAFLALLGQPVREGRVRKAGYREGEDPYWQLKLTVRNIVLI